MRGFRTIGSVALWLVASVVLHACAGDAPKNLDLGGTASPPPVVDQGNPWPDQAAPQDAWPNPAADSYAGAPFGCSVDDDCFGRRCCATPWGANLCMDECQPAPDPR